MFNTRNKSGISAHPCIIILYLKLCLLLWTFINLLSICTLVISQPPRKELSTIILRTRSINTIEGQELHVPEKMTECGFILFIMCVSVSKMSKIRRFKEYFFAATIQAKIHVDT